MPSPVLVLAANDLSLSDNDLVSTWSDTSGNNNHATESTDKPVFKTNVINSLPIVRFSSNYKLTLTNEITDGDCTFFCVIKETSGRMIALGGSAASNSNAFYGTSSGNVYWLFRGDNDTGLTLTPTYSGFNYWTSKVSSTSVEAWLNGTSIGTDTIPATRHLRQVGCRGNNFQFSDGDVAEIRYYNSALNDTDRQAVETDLYNKWFVSHLTTKDLTGTLTGSSSIVRADNKLLTATLTESGALRKQFNKTLL